MSLWIQTNHCVYRRNVWVNKNYDSANGLELQTFLQHKTKTFVFLLKSKKIHSCIQSIKTFVFLLKSEKIQVLKLLSKIQRHVYSFWIPKKYGYCPSWVWCKISGHRRNTLLLHLWTQSIITHCFHFACWHSMVRSFHHRGEQHRRCHRRSEEKWWSSPLSLILIDRWQMEQLLDELW